jgi:AcrR family transcriptional regulator
LNIGSEQTVPRERAAAKRASAGIAPVPPKPHARQVLMEVSEKLFGHCGLDGVSLREIALAAGQSNNAAVHYHFANKLGLLKEILDTRIAQTEALRQDWLMRLGEKGKANKKELLKIILLPVLEIRDQAGHYTFCRFLLQYLLHPDTVAHPVGELLENRRKRAAGPRSNLTNSVWAVEALQRLYPEVPVPVFDKRLLALTLMFFASVVQHENSYLKKAPKLIPAFDAAPILDIALAALSAPH